MTRNPPRGDRLSGGKGDDRIVGGGGGYRDLLLGGPGNDRLMTASGGYAESRTLKGGPGADRISTHSGSYETSLLGGRGPDALTSKGHNQFLVGGPGTDVLTLAGTGDTVLGLDADGNQIRIRGATYVVMIPTNKSGALEVDLAEGTIRRIGATDGDRIIDLSGPSAPVQFVVYGTDGVTVVTRSSAGRPRVPTATSRRVAQAMTQNRLPSGSARTGAGECRVLRLAPGRLGCSAAHGRPGAFVTLEDLDGRPQEGVRTRRPVATSRRSARRADPSPSR